MKRFVMRPVAALVCASGLLGVSTQAMASGFQLWEQDGASIGNYHAGYAAAAEDASTAFYNPAGITRFKNQQLVIGADAITTSFKFKGTVATNGLGNVPMQTTAQGGTFGLVPMLHYVAPISDKVGFGFSVDVPFGLKTDYGRSSPMRYAATLSSITVIDYSPSLAFQLTDAFSAGGGFDVQSVDAEFNKVGTLFFTANDTESVNKASDTGYGYHLGGLYSFTPDTRIGLSYHSQVAHHLTGNSSLIGPVANVFNGGPITSSATTNLMLPAYTSFGAYHKVNSCYAVMGNINFTQWNVFKQLILKNASGLAAGPVASNTLEVIIPEYYRNTWNVSLGADYFATDKIKIRAGVGYDMSPTRDQYRNTPLPDNDRYVFALGGHFQANKALGLDAGWTHFLMQQSRVAPPTLVSGASTVTTSGRVTGGADVIGGQVVWDIA